MPVPVDLSKLSDVVKNYVVKKLCMINWLSDCDWTRIQNHLVRKRILNHWPVWPNGWAFVYELSRSGFESSCSHLNFRFHACFEQGVPWHSDNYRVWVHSEMRTWHDKNIQLDKLVTKADNIDNSDFVLKIRYQAEKKELENSWCDWFC